MLSPRLIEGMLDTVDSKVEKNFREKNSVSRTLRQNYFDYITVSRRFNKIPFLGELIILYIVMTTFSIAMAWVIYSVTTLSKIEIALLFGGVMIVVCVFTYKYLSHAVLSRVDSDVQFMSEYEEIFSKLHIAVKMIYPSGVGEQMVTVDSVLEAHRLSVEQVIQASANFNVSQTKKNAQTLIRHYCRCIAIESGMKVLGIEYFGVPK